MDFEKAVETRNELIIGVVSSLLDTIKDDMTRKIIDTINFARVNIDVNDEYDVEEVQIPSEFADSPRMRPLRGSAKLVFTCFANTKDGQNNIMHSCYFLLSNGVSFIMYYVTDLHNNDKFHLSATPRFDETKNRCIVTKSLITLFNKIKSQRSLFTNLYPNKHVSCDDGNLEIFDTILDHYILTKTISISEATLFYNAKEKHKNNLKKFHDEKKEFNMMKLKFEEERKKFEESKSEVASELKN